MVAVGVAAASAAFPQPSLPVQLLAIAPLVAVVGLPHGAYDGVLGERLSRPRFGRAWPVVFASGYLGLAGAVVLIWWAMPVVALLAFLCYSAVHFGLEETEGTPAASWADVLALGALPIAMPAAGHPVQVAALFGWLLPAGVGVSPQLVRLAASPPAVAATAWVLARHRRPVHIAMAAVLLTAPPLIGFAVYFCLWHSFAHAASIAAGIDPVRPGAAWKKFVRRSLPATALSAAVAVVAAVWLARSIGIGPATARAVFITLAALTVPHMLLDRLVNPPARTGRRPTPAGRSPARPSSPTTAGTTWPP